MADRDRRKPFARQEKVAERIWDHLCAEGVLLYKAMGLNGIDGDAMVVGPPFIITEADMQRIVDALGAAVDATLGG